MNNFTFEILNALIPIILTIVAFYGSRYIDILKSKEELAKAIIIAGMVVKSVEQVWKDIPGDKKKEKALLLIEKMGVSMSLEQLDVLIESAVKEMKQNKE